MKRLLLAGLGIALATPALAAKDVTRTVIEQTQLDEQVAAACLQYCQGNRRRGWLERVVVEPLGGDLYRVQAEASLKNHQFTPAPLGLPLPDSEAINGEQKVAQQKSGKKGSRQKEVS